MKPVRHILLMPPNWIGDVIMAQPAMRAIGDHFRAADSDLRISVAGRGWLKDLLPWLNLGAADYCAEPIKADQVFLFPNSFRSAWQCRLAGNRSITGYSGQWRRLLLSTALPHRVDIAHQHHRDFHLDLPAQVGIATPRRHVELSSPADAIHSGQKFLSDHGLDPAKVITLAPGAQFGAAKCYPESGFRDVCHQLAAEGWQPVILGMQADIETGDAILSGLSTPCWNAAGQTKLHEALQLIAASRLMLCNDSGLMHVAAGLGVATVAPFGATDPERTSPDGPHVRILYHPAACSPCLQRECSVDSHPCMANITPQMLTTACNELLVP